MSRDMGHHVFLTRVVWHYNHGARLKSIEQARDAGYVVEVACRATYDEWRFSFDGRTVGIVHAFHGEDAEAFLFMFIPEATASRWSEMWWRLTHPFTRRADLPWPHRKAAA